MAYWAALALHHHWHFHAPRGQCRSKERTAGFCGLTLLGFALPNLLRTALGSSGDRVFGPGGVCVVGEDDLAFSGRSHARSAHLLIFASRQNESCWWAVVGRLSAVRGDVDGVRSKPREPGLIYCARICNLLRVYASDVGGTVPEHAVSRHSNGALDRQRRWGPILDSGDG